jgi:hypothetical protein
VIVDTSAVKDYAAITVTATAKDDCATPVTSSKIYFKVICPTDVVITQPLSYVKVASYEAGAGTETLTIEEFTTSDSRCPIEGYQVIGLVNGVWADPDCPSIPDSSVSCRKVYVDKAIIGDYELKFKIKAKGGNEVDSSIINIAVRCSSEVKLIAPFASKQIVEFK